ncbi:MAG: hypothetical protein R3D55_25735 [Chloroflexota bacterium]
MGSLVAEGVTVTAVSIGDGPDVPFLQNVAQWGSDVSISPTKLLICPKFSWKPPLSTDLFSGRAILPQFGDNSPILVGITAVPPLRLRRHQSQRRHRSF